MYTIRLAISAALILALAGCTPATPAATTAPSVAAASPTPTATATPTAAPTPSPTPAPSPTVNPLAVPPIPAPVAVALDAKTTAFVILDVFNPTCAGRPECVASVPKIAALIQKARAAGVPLLYSSTSPTNTFPPEIAPQPTDTILQPLAPIADKFVNTNIDSVLKEKKATTVLMVGTRSNGAVLYTAFGANARGYTVAVAVDGISGSIPFENNLTMWQLLNQPGFTNADNKPLADKLVTLTRGDLVTFK